MPSRSSRLRPGNRRHRLSPLYCAVAGDLCDRSVSVCSLRIPASNNHSVRSPTRPSANPSPLAPPCRPGRETRRGGTRAAEENRSRGDGRVRGEFPSVPSLPPAGEGRGVGGGGRWSPRPSTANRNKFHADHATSCVYFDSLEFYWALQPFYCLLFSSVDPRLIRFESRGWSAGGGDSCRG